jgi:UDP-N-acetylmuramoylalanine--D-glutamate ligase
MLCAAKKPTFLVGNIGSPALDILPKLKKNSRQRRGSLASLKLGRSGPRAAIVVFELSSFQLQDLDRSPDIAVVLDIFPDHQNSHLNLTEYYGAKANIAKHQSAGNKTFYLKGNQITERIGHMGRGKHIPVTGKNFSLFAPDDLKLKGRHNYTNAVMAATVAKTLDIPSAAIRSAASRFKGLPHRLEFVRTLRVKNGAIDIWNDSASSNPGAVAAAVRAFEGENFILLAGGKDKNLDYRPLADALVDCPAQLIVLFGENKNKIAKALSNARTPIHMAKNLENAAKSALGFAKKAESRVAIVLSPGSASFDMFHNFEERGDVFKRMVRELK